MADKEKRGASGSWQEDLHKDFNTPLSLIFADPEKDTPAGQDELGRRVYKTSRGKSYVVDDVKPAESIPETAKKIYENLPALDELRLPTGDEVKGGAKAVGEALWDVVEAPTNPDASLGDVFDLVATMAAPGASGILKEMDPATVKMFFGPDSPKAEARPKQKVVINHDDSLYKGGIKTSLDKATKPFAVRLTGQSQIDDMVSSGVVRPKPGGYGKDGKNVLYFGEMDEATPKSVFTTPKEDPTKNYTLVIDSSKVAGRDGAISLDELQHVWTKKDGKLVDVLPELLEANQAQARKYAKGGLVEPVVNQNVAPPGALPEEVADNVDIKASKGEYIVPANVVRFLGLDKIEKMVNKAKEQLAQLEEQGRIGGESDEDLPFSPEELQVIEGQEQEAPKMATGGLITGPATVEAPKPDIDPITGLPRWMGQTKPKEEKESGMDRVHVGPTGLAGSINQWTPDEFEKYSLARNDPGQQFGQYAASLIPFGGIAAKLRQRDLERNVPKRLSEMLETKTDLQGNPLNKDQLTRLEASREKMLSEPLVGFGGKGLVRSLGQETGLVKRRESDSKTAERQKEAVESDGLINRIIDAVSNSGRKKEDTKTKTEEKEKSSSDRDPVSDKSTRSRSKSTKK